MYYTYMWASQVVLVVKNLPSNAEDIRDVGSIPGSGTSPGGEHGNPLQYSCIENPMDRGAWRAMVQRVAKSQTQLKQLSTHACFINNEFLFSKCFIIMCQTCFPYNLVARLRRHS